MADYTVVFDSKVRKNVNPFPSAPPPPPRGPNIENKRTTGNTNRPGQHNYPPPEYACTGPCLPSQYLPPEYACTGPCHPSDLPSDASDLDDDHLPPQYGSSNSTKKKNRKKKVVPKKKPSRPSSGADMQGWSNDAPAWSHNSSEGLRKPLKTPPHVPHQLPQKSRFQGQGQAPRLNNQGAGGKLLNASPKQPKVIDYNDAMNNCTIILNNAGSRPKNKPMGLISKNPGNQVNTVKNTNTNPKKNVDTNSRMDQKKQPTPLRKYLCIFISCIADVS